MTDRPLRVLVTDAHERAVLATIRGLHQREIVVDGLANRRTGPGLWSRGLRDGSVIPDPRQDLEGFLAGVEATVARTAYDLLIPGTDASLLAISEQRGRFTPKVRLALPPGPAVAAALDRRALSEAAAGTAIAAPQEFLCADAEEVRRRADELGFPLLAKPVNNVRLEAGIATRWASVLVHDRGELERAARVPCVLQRRLQGRVVSLAGVFAGGALIAHAASTYLRTWPAEGGNVAYSETVSASPDLLDAVSDTLRKLDWEGIFELELIETAERYHAIDLNPRPYGSMALAIAAGANLPAIWALSACGRDPGPVAAATPGLRYRWADADARNALWRLQRGDVSALRSAMPIRAAVHPYFSRQDPLPGLVRIAQLAAVARERARATP